MPNDLIIRLEMDAAAAIERLMPLVEGGLEAEVITPEEGAELLVQEIVGTITLVKKDDSGRDETVIRCALEKRE